MMVLSKLRSLYGSFSFRVGWLHGDFTETLDLAFAPMPIYGALKQRHASLFGCLAENAGYSTRGSSSEAWISFMPNGSLP